MCLWFLSKHKRADEGKGYRDRTGETLFIDARDIGEMIDRTRKDLTGEDIGMIAGTYHAWRSDELRVSTHHSYSDQPGFCKSATLAEISANDFVLTPGRYVGAAPIEEDGILFEVKMAKLTGRLYGQMKEGERLDGVIRRNLEVLGYGEK